MPGVGRRNPSREFCLLIVLSLVDVLFSTPIQADSMGNAALNGQRPMNRAGISRDSVAAGPAAPDPLKSRTSASEDLQGGGDKPKQAKVEAKDPAPGDGVYVIQHADVRHVITAEELKERRKLRLARLQAKRLAWKKYRETLQRLKTLREQKQQKRTENKAIRYKFMEAKPVADKPVADKPVADKPMADKPITDKTMVDKPLDSKPMVDQPVNSRPSENKRMADIPIENKPVENRPMADKLIVNMLMAHRRAVFRGRHDVRRRMARRAKLLKRETPATREPPSTPPTTVASNVHYPGEGTDIRKSCDTCRLVLAWADFTRRKAPAEFNCLQLGVREDRIDYTQLTHCITNLCTDLLGSSLLLITRCQNFVFSNRQLLAQLQEETNPLDWSRMTLMDAKQIMGMFCKSANMCPSSNVTIGLFSAQATGTLLQPPDCNGFKRIATHLSERLAPIQELYRTSTVAASARATNLEYYPHHTCHCHFSNLLDFCVKSFQLPQDARLRFRCVDLVLFDAKQRQSNLCQYLCQTSPDTQKLAASYGQCSGGG